MNINNENPRVDNSIDDVEASEEELKSVALTFGLWFFGMLTVMISVILMLL